MNIENMINEALREDSAGGAQITPEEALKIGYATARAQAAKKKVNAKLMRPEKHIDAGTVANIATEVERAMPNVATQAAKPAKDAK
ncbi:MAG: hypothetical protein AAF512_00685 [Pseudomonadota bacterium]